MRVTTAPDSEASLRRYSESTLSAWSTGARSATYKAALDSDREAERRIGAETLLYSFLCFTCVYKM